MSYIDDKRHSIKARDLQTGTHVLYRLNWYEVLCYHAEEQTVLITNGKAIESIHLPPNRSVIVKTEGD